MNNEDLKFNISFFGLLSYEVALIVFALDGVSISKLFFTGLVWISFFIAFFEFVNNYKKIKKNIPNIGFIFLIVLLVWNIISVFRSILFGAGPITTTLGNVAAALSVLVPFVIVFSFRLKNLKNVYDTFIRVLKLTIPIFFILLLLFGNSLSAIQLRALLALFIPVIFLITGLPFYSKKNKRVVLICAILLLYIAVLHSVRTMMIREILLFLGLLSVYLFGKFKQRLLLIFSCFALFMPFLLLQQSFVTGESPFDTYLGGDSDSEINTDTRTFLYTELYTDLINTNAILTGKGANGTYFSPYFSDVDEGETSNRNNIEVGILGLLLKGGMIAVFLNFGLLVIAIYFAFFKSKNLFVIGVGYILLIHSVLLFLENYIVYSLYNYAIWFFIGLALSKTLRNMTDIEIKILLEGRIRKIKNIKRV